MRVTSRRGLALLECLVACVLTATLAGLALATLAGLQRLTQSQAERGAGRAALRTAMQLLRAELRDLSTAAPSDLLFLGPTSLRYRASRSFARACGLTGEGLLVSDSTFRGLRLPAPGRDTLELLLPGATGVEPRWIRGEILADDSPALAIPVVFPGWTDPPPVESGSPVRTWEVMELRVYSSGGEPWLGVRSVSAAEAIQPVGGPLAPPGLGLSYLDPGGTVTTDSARVASITVVLRVRGDASHAVGGAARAGRPGVDSARIVVHLLNGARP
jgi:hypothetical protein